MTHVPHGPYEKFIKRPLDCVLAAGALAGLSPVMGIIALAVRLNLGSPVLFSQDRPGRIDPETGRERIFKLYKFRTMTDGRDDSGALLPDEERLTDFGKFLRSTSLDELPELINIVKGDMAIVGPRPLLVRYLERYSAKQRRRHEVRPGLTGLAQVRGRNEIDWDEKFDWDIRYVDNITFAGDVRIILETIRVVLDRSGIHSDTSATMEEFMGSKEQVT